MSLQRIALGAGLLVLLAGCALMDYQLDPRAGVINHQTDNARNNEILLNIIRASHSQPLNFVPISKASGTQTTDLKVGLPTFTLGPFQTLMEKQFQFAGNTWDNSSNGSFDSAPLATHDFYANMMSPIALETASALVHMGYSRELVLNTVIAAIRVEGASQTLEYRNDPLGEPDATICPEADQFYGPQRFLNGSPYAPENRQPNLDACEYHIFQFYLQAAMDWGFNIQVKMAPNPAYTPDAVKQAKGSGKDPPPKTISAAQFCFDPAFTKPGFGAFVRTLPDRCGAVALDKKPPTTNQQSLTVVFQNGKNKSATLTFTVIIRSSFAAFSYFGHVLRAYPTTPVRLYWPDRSIGSDDIRDMQILAVTQSPANWCFANTYLNGAFYCVPSDAGDTTKQVFSMLSQLVALNTTTGSLPTTLEVRLQ
jgi:hypothetical protein